MDETERGKDKTTWMRTKKPDLIYESFLREWTVINEFF